MPWYADSQVWIGFFTLTLLEVVLGVDNIVFISIMVGKLPPEERKRAWNAGLMLALIIRVVLLLGISIILKLDKGLFNAMGHDVTGRDLVLLAGGLFLIWKAVKEIHGKLEGEEHGVDSKASQFSAVMVQLTLLNFIFSIDSVLTAIGMSNILGVMIAAVIASTALMLLFARAVGDFVENHPTVKMLGLAFLILIGMNLVAEGTGFEIPKGYTYFAMAFAVIVEMLNLRVRAKSKPVHLHEPELDREATS